LGGTFHGFGKLLPDKTVKIDYIFTDMTCEDSYIVEDVPVNGQFYSDHNAVCAIVSNK
jgi:endonuclease/exonuclease/phosphatase family metal-dependent hydrolase